MTASRVEDAFACRTAVGSRWTANADKRPLPDLDPAGSLPRSLVGYLTTGSPQPAIRVGGDATRCPGPVRSVIDRLRGCGASRFCVAGSKSNAPVEGPQDNARAPQERGQHRNALLSGAAKPLAARRTAQA